MPSARLLEGLARHVVDRHVPVRSVLGLSPHASIALGHRSGVDGETDRVRGAGGFLMILKSRRILSIVISNDITLLSF